MPSSNEDSERKFWQVNPEIFATKRPRGRFELVVDLFRGLARIVSLASLTTYPLILIIVGLVFGGVAFWGFFSVSLILIGLVIWKTGYARNFAAWNPSLGRQVAGLTLGFLMAAGLYLGLTRLQSWMIPISFAALGVGVVFLLRREH